MNKTIIKEDYDLLKQAVNTTEDDYLKRYQDCAELTEAAIAAGNKVLLCGNGGSASTASHITNDFISHMADWNRKGYPAIALNDPAVMTAVSNDYGYDQVFARQVNALGKEGDVLWVFSTSGNSSNIINAVEEAKRKNMKTVVFTGINGGKLKDQVDIWCPVNTDNLIASESLHLYIIHSIAKVIEADLG